MFVKIRMSIERHCGLDVRVLACSEEGPRIENHPQSGKRKKLSIHYSSKCVSDSLQSWVGKIKVVKGKENGTTFHVPYPVTHVEP